MPGNDVVVDARVLKYLATLEAMGLDVVAIGVARSGEPRDFHLGDARVIVPVVPLPRASRLAARAGQVRVVFAPGYRTVEDRRAAAAQLARWDGVVARRPRAMRPPLRLALLGARAWYAVASLRRQVRSADPEVAAEQRRAEIERYRREPARAPWRTVVPWLLDDARTIGPILDELEPDVIHVHDVYMLGVAAEAVRRQAAAGRRVHLLYDAHEFVPGIAFVPPRTIGAYANLEAEYLPEAERVITVSEPLADLLQAEHGLARRPDVVLNGPVTAPRPPGFTDLRALLGLDPHARLLVYGGGVNTARGVHTAVEGLVHLPEAHLAVVINRHNWVVEALVQRARELGVGDRVHLAPYVAPELVPHYFATADVGLSTLMHAPNHDVAVTNKFCEYLAAGIPVVTSDTPAQADLVRELDLGAVYPAGDARAFAAAVRTVLADLDRFRTRIADDAELRRRFSWAAQAEEVRRIYAEVLGELPPRAWEPGALDITSISPASDGDSSGGASAASTSDA